MNVIEVRGLRKRYARWRKPPTLALDGLDLTVPAGGVFGFLGPNGSGKTTTIRCLLGLVGVDEGSARLLGRDRADLAEVLPRVGSLVEQPALFPSFSGRKNLRLLGRMQRIGPSRVEEVLERVGLAERGDDLFRTYSLGMKQRLGIAAALLKDPELLILDEPANGLDPAGIKEIRELLRTLGEEGRTVFVSSHLLGEVEQMCDSVAIIARGRHVTTGAVEDVVSQSRRVTGIIARVPGAEEKAAEVLRAAGFEVTLNATGALVVNVDAEQAQVVNRKLVSKRLYLSELRPIEVNLETAFLELTSNDAAQGMRCATCQNAISPSAKFCTVCGTPVGEDA